MVTAFVAVLLAAELIAPASVEASAGKSDQSQFTRPAQPAETMRFRDMDRNSDGVITRAEWRGTEQSFRSHDWNSDGILSGDEVRTGALRPGASANAEIADDREDTFDNLDENRNNQIERSEWHESADAFRWLDRNNDGVLTRREVVGRGAAGQAIPRSQNPRNPRASTGTAGQDCVDNAARIVDDIYQQVLERPADQASAGMTQALLSGRMTVRDIVRQLAKSEEHTKRYFWLPVATTLYKQMLQRDPSPQEIEQMTSELDSGQIPIDVVARAAKRAAGSDEEAVKMLYRGLLGREADEQGLRDFTNLAQQRGIETVARDILTSPEYRQRVSRARLAPDDAAYEAAVRSLYRHVLGRDPDANGLRDLTRIAESSGVDAVVDRMLSSAEYERLYGNDGVPGRNVRYCGPTR